MDQIKKWGKKQLILIKWEISITCLKFIKRKKIIKKKKVFV